jgi:hypothetical protein
VADDNRKPSGFTAFFACQQGGVNINTHAKQAKAMRANIGEEPE